MHSLDSLRIAETVNRLGQERQVITDVLIQVNMSREASKHGFRPDDMMMGAVEAVADMPQLRLRGLMTIGPLGGESDGARACFRELYELRERIVAHADVKLPELSMGMSGDFEEAIEEGATIVRIGTALTGPRVNPGAP
jgi:pyridoxal phosphate enzyme (YggS family)